MDVRELTADRERREAVPMLRHLWGVKPPKAVLAWTAADDDHLFVGFTEAWAGCEHVALASPVEKADLHQ